jgi:radical SAM protein with 4Fe4S-binding SPASM domain
MHNHQNYLKSRINPDGGFEELLGFPKYLEIETVNACNARCPMCTIEDWERNIPLMKDEVFEKVLSDIKDHVNELKRVSLYRDGEPLIDKKISKRIASLKKIGVKEVSIASNLALLDEATSLSLLESELDILVCSFDSLNKPVYEAIRKRLVFEEVLENILRFIRLRKEGGYRTKIWMRMIRQKENYNEWESYLKFWQSQLNKDDRIYFHNIFNWGGQLNNYIPVSTNTEINKPCVALWSLLVIYTDGKVPLCNVDFNNKHQLGDIMKSSIREVWKNTVLNKYREMHIGGLKSEIPICISCNVWEDHNLENIDFMN